MPMSPEDAAAMFDLPPPVAAAPTAEAEDALAALEAAEAALAAELAESLEAGGVAADAPDSRAKLRVAVSWAARMRLPDGRVVELEVRDVSEGGVGLVSGEPIPAHTIVDFDMHVPAVDGGGGITSVKGTIRTTYTVAHGAKILGGATWVQLLPADRELVNLWIARLRR
jgi:hypothetical protein